MALSAAQSMIAERYRKMIKMGMPEGAVMQKMTTDEVEQQIIDAVMGGGQEETKTAEPPKGALSAEDEEIVAKYRKMMKMGMPEGAVMQKMATDEVEQRLVDVVAAGQQEEKKEEAKPAEPSKDVLSADDEEIVAKYRKMMKMGMPEGAVLQKMATDEIEQRLVDVVAAGQQEETKEEAKTAEPPKDTLSAEEEEIVAKYRKMMKMGMPEGAVLQKMATDEIEQRLIDVVAAGQQEESKENAAVPAQGKGDQPDSSDEVVTMSLSPEEEEIATKYRKMLTMGMPEGAVMQKMTTDEVEQHIVDSVIAGASSEPSEEVEKPEEGQEPERSAREGLEHQESVYSFEESIVEEELMDGDDGNQGGGRPPNSNRSMGSEGSVEYEYITDDDEELFDEEEITTESGHDQSGEAGIQGSAEMLTSAAVQNSTSDSEDQEEGITVEESIEEPVVVETVQSSDNSEAKGNEAVRHIPDEEDDDMPADEKAARAAAVAQAATTLQSVQDDNAKDKSEPEDEMTRVAMETDAILLGQSASRDEIHDSDEEEEVEFEDSASDEDDNSSSDDSSVEDDIENQRKRQTPVSLPPPGERRTRRQPNPDKGFHMFVFICYFFLIGGGVVVSLLFVLGAVDTKNKDDTTPSEQEFTYFDPIQTPDNCNIGGLENPHVIDQCNCNGMVTVISDSIRQRYDEHRAFFIPSIYQTYEESINSCSTRNQALLWLSSGNDSTFGPEERRQRFALANFFIGTKGEEWTDQMGWLSPDASCSWWGLTCAATQAVESLLMERNNVGGTIPRELVLLESLKSVALTQNSLQGNIPQELFFIPSLQELYLNDNQFGGSIPLALLGAVQLQTLDLELNQLTGSIPKDIAQVTALESFILGSNELIGDIPTGLFDLPQLTDLQLHDNNLTGSIPSEIANAQSLNTLTLGPNKFQGTFPNEITELTTLERLSFRGIPATGRLPATLAEMQELQVLVISETEITGFIPFVLGSTMDKLSILDLSGNRLTDVIPSSLGQLARLDLLNLSGNMISGFIPSELGNLDSITQLRLNDNRLSGEVPDELGQLDTLEEIFLDGNALEGEVPSQVCSLRLGELTQLVVDCDDGITGVACSIPSCCTNCRA